MQLIRSVSRENGKTPLQKPYAPQISVKQSRFLFFFFFFRWSYQRTQVRRIYFTFLIIVVSQDPGSVKYKSVSVILLAGGKGKRMGVSFSRVLSCNKLIHYVYCPYSIYISECVALIWEKNVFTWMIAFVYSLFYAVCSLCISSYSWSFISDCAIGKHAEAVSSTSRPTHCNVQVDSNISATSVLFKLF